MERGREVFGRRKNNEVLEEEDDEVRVLKV